VLHVGAPKPGTSFVQDLMFRSREQLAGLGTLYPADRFDAHFLAALDLMELPWGGLEQTAAGRWERLAAEVRAWPGDAVISHEILATASREQVARALSSLSGAPPGQERELHVVMSVRDLVRQVPAEWQDNVKHRRTLGYRDFLAQITDPARATTVASWFWGVQEVPAILDRWGATLPPERVHVITVPKPGAPVNLLWERFAEAFGLDPDALDATSDRSNPSLGVAETALVRRLNERVNGGVLANEHYREFVRELLAHRTLSRRTDAPRLRLPDDVRGWAVRLNDDWIEELAQRGYHVIGSLDDLRPDPLQDSRDDRVAPAYLDPDDPPLDQLSDAALSSLVALLQQAAALRVEVTDLHGEIARLHEELAQARREVGLSLRARRAVVSRAETSRAGRVALRAYRRARRR
jgi:hypothetical protein